jgi:hypothetical protein
MLAYGKYVSIITDIGSISMEKFTPDVGGFFRPKLACSSHGCPHRGFELFKHFQLYL